MPDRGNSALLVLMPRSQSPNRVRESVPPVAHVTTMYLWLVSFLFCLVAFGLPAAKLLDVIDWSWWVIAAPLQLTLAIALFAWGARLVLWYRRPLR